ncbi:MAG TPA: cell division topological specificity factor MinE [Anaerolineales bacterium]|jgi:cell division topological specificity factor|nr:cell division topological specificity factor MinE [Anaerolineales bacterium]
MKDLFDRLLGKDRRSANAAKERLQLVLIHDRTDLSPGLLEDLRDELVAVISRHVDVDSSAVRLEMTSEGREQRLVADIPLKTRMRR